MHFAYKNIFLYCLLAVLPHFAAAQQTVTDKTSVGTEFWICFPKNDLPNTKKESPDAELWLYISSVGGAKAEGTISYFLKGVAETIPFSVRGTDVAQIELPAELEILSHTDTEHKGVHVQSNYDIALYGLSKDFRTSEAFLCYPVATLSLAYITASQPHYVGNTIGSPANRYSGFVVLATEDQTLVKVRAPVPLQALKAVAYESVEFKLNKGETRYITASWLNSFDITGAITTADKKISVFMAHERMGIPSYLTRDALFEQAPPISILGTQAFFTPHTRPTPLLKTIARIIAPFDSTRITIGDSLKILNKSQFLTIEFDSAFAAYSNKPVLCVQYEPSSQAQGNADLGTGDPFMAVIAPAEQFLKSYTFISAPFKSFTEHWVNVTIHRTAFKSVMLDGEPVNEAFFTNVSGSDFVFAQIPVSAGQHVITADSAFGIIAYGYGIADSYGYTGGMRTEKIIDLILDKNRPAYTYNDNCGEFFLKLFEENEFDSGIELLEVIRAENLTATATPFKKGDITAEMRGELLDPYHDGEIEYLVKDRAGNVRQQSFFVPGFTLRAFKNSPPDIMQGEIFTDTLFIENYGRFPQTATASLFKNIEISIPPAFSLSNIEPGERRLIPVAISSESTGTILDSVFISGGCSRVITTEISANITPVFFSGISQCGVHITTGKSPGNLLKFLVSDGTLFIENAFKNSVFTVYSVTGEEVLRAEVSGAAGIDISQLPAGMYVFSIGESRGKFYITQ
jgi:hypothetical protein